MYAYTKESFIIVDNSTILIIFQSITMLAHRQHRRSLPVARGSATWPWVLVRTMSSSDGAAFLFGSGG